MVRAGKKDANITEHCSFAVDISGTAGKANTMARTKKKKNTGSKKKNKWREVDVAEERNAEGGVNDEDEGEVDEGGGDEEVHEVTLTHTHTHVHTHKAHAFPIP